MHFGEALDDGAFVAAIRGAFDAGVRTFVTADVYGVGRADSALGEALDGVPREQYSLIGLVGHDFEVGTRQGSAGYPRFTEPGLRAPSGYRDYVRTAVSRSLERCRTDSFDVLLLHNPDEIGYTRDAVWEAFRDVRDQGLARKLGVAPGPANGFALDLIQCFERFAEVVDWAMLILNPNEPWPGRLVLPAARTFEVDVLARVVDHGGIFWGDVRPGHVFRPGDHRSYRPAGWVEEGWGKWQKMKPIADRHGLSPLAFASAWCLSQEPVRSVVPTVIQEAGDDAVPLAEKLAMLAGVSPDLRLSAEEVEEVARIGDNTGCMLLKGASRRHQESLRPDEWPMRADLEDVASRYGLGLDW